MVSAGRVGGLHRLHPVGGRRRLAGVRLTGQSSHGCGVLGGPARRVRRGAGQGCAASRHGCCASTTRRASRPTSWHVCGRSTRSRRPRLLYDDVLLRITATGPQGVRLAGEIDQSNSQALRRLLGTLLDRALRSHSAPAAITVDLASLRFVDVAGAGEPRARRRGVPEHAPPRARPGPTGRGAGAGSLRRRLRAAAEPAPPPTPAAPPARFPSVGRVLNNSARRAELFSALTG